jgi:GNAT superfamily N-acetyltransferase
MGDHKDNHKVPPFAIVEITNADGGFYELMGPFLSRPEIAKELGSPVWDRDGKRWIIAKGAAGVLGFVGYEGGSIRSLYVTPNARGEMIGITLVMRAVSQIQGAASAIATEAGSRVFAQCGFREKGMRGRYHLMERAQ